MNATRTNSLRRAVSMVEAVVVVLVLALSVPPTLGWLMDNSAQRVNSVQATRAAVLATLILEQVVADSTGIDAGASPTYVTAATTGLAARLASSTAPYTAAGLTWTASLSTPVDDTLTSSTTGGFRVVTVKIMWTDSGGVARSVPFSAVVARP